MLLHCGICCKLFSTLCIWVKEVNREFHPAFSSCCSLNPVMLSLSVVSWCCVSMDPLIFVIEMIYFWWDGSIANWDDSQFSLFLFSCRKADATGSSWRNIWCLGSGGGWRSDCRSGGHNMYGVQERKEAPYRNRQRSVSTSLTDDIDCGHFLQWPILSPALNKIACSCCRNLYSNTREASSRSCISFVGFQWNHQAKCKQFCSFCWLKSTDIQLQSWFLITNNNTII